MQHRAKKSLGQNFLKDPHVIAKIIAESGITAQDHVIEIGPGLGALSLSILKMTGALTAIEFDRDVITSLQQKCAPVGTLNIIHEDVLKVDFKKLAGNHRIKLIGNLPYNISSAILFHLIPFAAIFKDMHFMLQKEVVDRITARPNNKIYGRLSVMLQYDFHCEGLFCVPPAAFIPAPKVDSRILRLIPKVKKSVIADDETFFAEIVKQSFQQRRKTLKKSLNPFIQSNDCPTTFPVDLTLRPENLSVEDFVSLSNFIGTRQ